MVQTVQFTGAYLAEPLSSLTPGSWYIGFECVHCHQHFALMNDPTNSGDLHCSGTANFNAACPNCGVRGDYPATDLVPFAAAQGGPTSTA